MSKPVTIRGVDQDSKLNIGSTNYNLDAEIILDQISLKGSHSSNHGDGSDGLFANGHKLIIGTGVDTGNSNSVTGYPQLFGGASSNKNKTIDNTILIVHSGTYDNIVAGSGNKGEGIKEDTKVVLRNVTVLDTLAGGSAKDAGNISGSTWIYATALYMPGDYYEETSLGYIWKDGLPKLTESTIITGGSNGTDGGKVGGSTHVLLSGISEVWDVQGGGRRGGTEVADTSKVEISGNAVVKHIACGGITDGESSTWNVKDVYLSVKDDARVAMLLGGGYDTWGSPGTGSTISGNITIKINGGTVGYVYGGGFRGVVGSSDTAVKISIEGGTVLNDVYGGGRGGFDKVLHENSGVLNDKENNGFKDTTGYSKLTAKSIKITVGEHAVVKGSVYGGGQSTPVINIYNGATGLQGKYHNGQLLNVAEVFAGNVSITISGVVNGSVFSGGKGIDTSLFDETTSAEYREWTNIIGMKASGELGYFPWFKNSTSSEIAFDTNVNYGGFASSNKPGAGDSSRSVTVSNGTVGGSVYGGGAIGITNILGAVSVHVESGHVKGSVFGGGMGSPNNEWAGKVQAGNINVIIGENGSTPTVKGSVYGGGAYSLTISIIQVTIYNGIIEGNVFSGGLGTEKAQSTAGIRTLYIRGGRVKGSVYGSSSFGNDGSYDETSNTYDTYNTTVEITGGTVDGSVYGAGFKGVTYGNTSITVSGTAVIGMSVYGGADVGVTYADTFDDVKVYGTSTISIDGTGGASVAGSVFGSGNSCLVNGTKTIHIKGLKNGTVMASVQNADTVDIEGSHLTLTGRASGTASSASTKYSLNNIKTLNLSDGTYLELRVGINDIGEYHSKVNYNGADTSSSNPKNTIRLAEGKAFEVRDSGGYRSIYGYTVLSLNPAELYYGAFAYGSTGSTGGFVIHREGTYVKADTQDFGSQCRLWFIGGAVLRTTTLVASDEQNSIQSEELIPRTSAGTKILYSGHVLSVGQTSKMRLVKGDPTAEGDFRLTLGYNGSGLVTFGGNSGTVVYGMDSTAEIVGEGDGTKVGFRFDYYTPRYSGFTGSVHLSFIEAVEIELANGERGYLHQNRIDYRIDVYTDASGEFGGDYTVPIVLRGGQGSGEFVIPRSFYDYRLVLKSFDLSGMPGANLTIAPGENNEGTLGWAHPLGDPVGPSANTVIGTLTGSFNSTLVFAISNGSENQRAVLEFSLEHDTKETRNFRIEVTTENVRMHTVVFVDYEYTEGSDEPREIRRTATVPHGSVIPASAVPVTGNGFIGWYEDKDTKKPFNLSQPITYDRTAYAGYKYTVTFDLMNGKTLTDFADFPGGSPVNKPEVEREGYTLEGWYYDREFKSKAFVDGNNNDVNIVLITKDTTFYAKWVGKSVAVTFYFISQNNERTTWNLTYQYGQLYKDGIGANTFETITNEAIELSKKEGKEFVRWELAELESNNPVGQNVFIYEDVELLKPTDHILLADCRNIALKVDLIGQYIDSNGGTIPEDRRFGDISIDAPKSILVFEENGEFRFTPSNAATTGYSLHEWRFEDSTGQYRSVDAGVELVFVKTENGFKLNDKEYSINGHQLVMETCWKAMTYEVHIQEPAGGTVSHTTSENLMKVPYGTKLTFEYTPGGPYILKEWVLSGEGTLEQNGNSCSLYVKGNCLLYLRLGGSYKVDISLKIDGVPADGKLMLKSGDRERPLAKGATTGSFFNTGVETGYYDLYIEDKGGVWLKVVEDVLIQNDYQFTCSLYSIDVNDGENRIDKNLVSYPDYSVSGKEISVRLPTEGYDCGKLTKEPSDLNVSGTDPDGTIQSSEISFAMPSEKVTLTLNGFGPKMCNIKFIYKEGEPGFKNHAGNPYTIPCEYGAECSFPALNTDPNYVFSRWELIEEDGDTIKIIRQYTGVSFRVEKESMILRPVWNNGTVDYHIDRYYQNVTGDGYVVERITMSGKAHTPVQIGDDVRRGFHLNTNPDNLLSGILIDGLVLKGYYDRDVYEISTILLIDGQAEQDLGKIDMRYGAKWDPGIYSNIPFGYEITGWYEDNASENPIDAIPLDDNHDKKITLYVRGTAYIYKVIYDKDQTVFVYGSTVIDLGTPEDENGRVFDKWTVNGYLLDGNIINSKFLEDHKITEKQLVVKATWGYLITVKQPPAGMITVTGAKEAKYGKYTVLWNTSVTFSYDPNGTNEKIYCWHIGEQSSTDDSVDFRVKKDLTVGIVLELRAEGSYSDCVLNGIFNASENGEYTFDSDIQWNKGSIETINGFEVSFSGNSITVNASDALGTVRLGYIVHQDTSGEYYRIFLTATIISGIHPTEEL